MITVDKKKIPWEKGMTVAQVLEHIHNSNIYAVVRINGKTVSKPNFEKTRVPDNATMILIPMIAGG